MTDYREEWAELVHVLHGTYVDIVTDGGTGLSCGQCDWVHILPAPFLLGDAVRIAAEHRRKCGRADEERAT